MTGRTWLVVALVASLIAVAVLATVVAVGGGSDSQAVADAEAAQKQAEDKLANTRDELSAAQQEIDDLAAQVKALNRQLKKATASPSPSPTTSATSDAYTPPAGSSERKAILDAVRKKINWKHLFIVYKLKVQTGWAYAVLEQTNPNAPDTKYERFSALCRLSGSTWTCLEAVGGSDATDIEETTGLTIPQWLQKKYPAAPAGIFK